MIIELSYCATVGFKTVLLQGFPSGKAYPLKEDDTFWAAALDLKMPVSVTSISIAPAIALAHFSSIHRNLMR